MNGSGFESAIATADSKRVSRRRLRHLRPLVQRRHDYVVAGQYQPALAARDIQRTVSSRSSLTRLPGKACGGRRSRAWHLEHGPTGHARAGPGGRWSAHLQAHRLPRIDSARAFLTGYERHAGQIRPLQRADFAKWVAALAGWFSFTGRRALGDFEDTDAEAAEACGMAIESIGTLRHNPRVPNCAHGGMPTSCWKLEMLAAGRPGSRGVGFSRANLFGRHFDSYVSEAQAPLLVAMIEHCRAVDDLPAIVAVDGLDAILIGPYDLSASIG